MIRRVKAKTKMLGGKIVAKKHRAESYLERAFDRVIVNYDIPQPQRQYCFHKFEFDFAWPQIKVCVEIDGGTYMSVGGHARGGQYMRDCIKNNLAQFEGWIVLRADSVMVGKPEFAKLVKAVIIKRINERICNGSK
jgi:very-short-patch-repair endonuclease